MSVGMGSEAEGWFNEFTSQRPVRKAKNQAESSMRELYRVTGETGWLNGQRPRPTPRQKYRNEEVEEHVHGTGHGEHKEEQGITEVAFAQNWQEQALGSRSNESVAVRPSGLPRYIEATVGSDDAIAAVRRAFKKVADESELGNRAQVSLFQTRKHARMAHEG